MHSILLIIKCCTLIFEIKLFQYEYITKKHLKTYYILKRGFADNFKLKKFHKCVMSLLKMQFCKIELLFSYYESYSGYLLHYFNIMRYNRACMHNLLQLM